MEAKVCSQLIEDWKVVFPINTTFIPDELKERAKTELFEDDDTRVNGLRLFRSMLRDQANFTWQDEELFLLSFLRARKYDLKRAFILMKRFYSALTKFDELRNFSLNNIKRTLQHMKIGYLPYKDSEGCVIFVYHVGPWDPHVISFGDIAHANNCLFHLAIRSPATQISGIKLIVDLAGFSARHIPYISLSHIWLASEGLQNSFPARFRGVHMVNENFLFSYIWSMFKLFLSKKIKERWHFHGKDVKKLHKYFSPSILPAEYEGELPPFENSSTIKEVEKYAGYLSHLFTFGDEKCKSNNESKNSSGNPMHFLRRLSNSLTPEDKNFSGDSMQTGDKFSQEK